MRSLSPEDGVRRSSVIWVGSRRPSPSAQEGGTPHIWTRGAPRWGPPSSGLLSPLHVERVNNLPAGPDTRPPWILSQNPGVRNLSRLGELLNTQRNVHFFRSRRRAAKIGPPAPDPEKGPIFATWPPTKRNNIGKMAKNGHFPVRTENGQKWPFFARGARGRKSGSGRPGPPARPGAPRGGPRPDPGFGGSRGPPFLADFWGPGRPPFLADFQGPRWGSWEARTGGPGEARIGGPVGPGRGSRIGGSQRASATLAKRSFSFHPPTPPGLCDSSGTSAERGQTSGAGRHSCSPVC